MGKADESKIRRDGFPIDRKDAKALLDFIKITNPSHDMIEPEIIVKLELLSGKLHIVNVEESSD